MRYGVDLGGTKIEIVALDAEGAICLRRRIPSPGDYHASIEAIRDLVISVDCEMDVVGSVGVGIPGAISPATGLVKNANSTWLIGHAFDRDLASALSRPVRVANDANCFALSEAIDGAGAGHRCVFGAILGTGVGGGIAVNGKVLSGPNAIAGEWGHNPLPWPSAAEAQPPSCYCGRRGCIEAWCSGPGLSRDYAEVTGHRLTAEAIADRAASGDVGAASVLQRLESRLARAFAALVNVLDPDVIVLGGGLSNLDHLYTNLPALITPYVFSDQADIKICKNVWGDSSGVRGAAWLWGSLPP